MIKMNVIPIITYIEDDNKFISNFIDNGEIILFIRNIYTLSVYYYLNGKMLVVDKNIESMDVVEYRYYPGD